MRSHRFKFRVSLTLALAALLCSLGQAAGTQEPKSWLGVTVRPATAEQAREAGLPQKLGVVVLAAYEGAPAAAAGLEVGDLVVKVNDTWIEGVEDIAQAPSAQ